MTSLIAVIALTASVAQALPATQPVSGGMVDGPVRTIAQAGGVIWVGGQFTQIQDQGGVAVQGVNGLAAFDTATGVPAQVHIPQVSLSTGPSTVYDLSVASDGTLYLAGDFDAVDGVPRWNVAAIDPASGALLPFAPHVAQSMSVLAAPAAIYVGGLQLEAFHPNGTPLPTWVAPAGWVNPTLRGHPVFPDFRDIARVGDTLVAACVCDKIFDAAHPSPDGMNVKALVQIDGLTGAVSPWVPGGLQTGPSGSTTFGERVIVRRDPATGSRTIYLAAGGNDFTAAYDYVSGAQLWKTDTSGSSQAIAWYQGLLIVGGHFEWTESPLAAGCGDNANPNLDCYHTPKLVAMDPGDGAVVLLNGQPWNPGICCKYNGIWALHVDLDDSLLHVGGEFTKLGGNWQLTTAPDTWQLAGARDQGYYGRLPGPAAASHPLDVASVSVGAGSGSVTSDVGGIDCGTSCDADLAPGTTVALSATPSAGYSFLGWSGDCSGTISPCSITMNRARSVVASFGLATYPLSVGRDGTGSGKVTSDLGGINCGSACSATLTTGTTVILTATAISGSIFTGWGGDCAGVELTCALTVDQAHTATATFAPAKRLTLTPAGTGGGSVVSAPAGIDCGLTCTITFAVGTPVTLTATPDANSTFQGWSGSSAAGCAGIAPCTVTMSAQRNLTATFAPILHQVGVSRAGDGSGSVTSDVGGIDCGTVCGTTLQQATNLTLTATATPGSVFTGWGGDCAGSVSSCSLTLDGDRAATATFKTLYALGVSPAGTGGGTIASGDGGIDCGTTCSHAYASGTTVTLTATPDAGSRFDGWGGACAGTGSCAVALDQARTVSASFSAVLHRLTVTRAGNGTGTVSSSPTAITCGATCAADIRQASAISLTATPDLGSTFTGWSGDCAGTGTCDLSMDGPHAVTATFVPSYQLTVTRGGTGGGIVGDGDPNGIACGATCSKGYVQGTVVTLTAEPDAGSIFGGWSGACAGANPVCLVTMGGDRAAAASFLPVFHTLTVGRSGDGVGAVTGAGGAIDCGTTCSADLRRATAATLTATAGAGSIFLGWSGACAGTLATCTVSIDGNRSVTALFKGRYELTIARTGAGAGSVASDVGLIACGSTCADTYTSGDIVTLSATPDPNSTFTGWTGDCVGSGACTVTMDRARAAGAVFAPIVQRLSVSVLGAGSVTSAPAGIACPASCWTDFAQPTAVTLSARPSPGWFFAGWGGGCSGTGTCQAVMSQPRSATATFVQAPPCGRVLFTTKRSGNIDIWAMNANGSSQTRLTTSAGADIQAEWSPDCARIAYVSSSTGNDQIYVMNADGTGVTQVTSSGGNTEPTWSPDGTRILFVSDRAGAQKLFVMNADGSGVAQVSSVDTPADTHPDWSPSGAKIVFTSRRTGGNQVWVMNADGSGALRITKNLAACQDPSWSPDGSRVAVICKSSGTQQVWTVSPTGTLAQRVTVDAKNDANPSWSPDGTRIAFSSNASGAQQIWTVGALGGGAVNVSNSVSKDTEPHWS